MSGDRIRRHGKEIDAEFDAAIALLLMEHCGKEFERFCVDRGLDGGDGAFGEKVRNGGAAHVVDAVVDGAEDWMVMVSMSSWELS